MLLFMKETTKLPFITQQGQGKTTEKSDVDGSKFKEVNFSCKNFIFLFFITLVFKIYQNTSLLTVFKRNTECRTVRI